jgi:NDP-sugar pyrophosphorylase family protein
MRAVVLAGGRGTRLAPYTIAFPKPLVPIGEIPIIEIVLRQLRWHGIREVIISVGYLAELIQAYFVTRGGIPGLEIKYLREDRPLGTAGAIGLLGPEEDDLLVMNGDILTTLDMAQMMEFHRQRKPALTIAVYPRTVRIDLGVLEIDGENVVRGYAEKPTLSYQCSMGIYLYSPRAVRAIEPGERLDFPDLVLRLLNAGETVLGYQSECYWLDIGRREDYERALEEFPQRRLEFLPDEKPERE